VEKIVEWNWEEMGREARKWIRNDVPALLFEKFGDNEFGTVNLLTYTRKSNQRCPYLITKA